MLIAREAPLSYDDESLNAAVLTAVGKQSFDQVRDLLRQTHQRLLTLLMEQDEANFTSDHPVLRRVKAMTQHSLELAQALEELLL